LTSAFTESAVESADLAWLAASGYAMLYGQNIAAGERAAERSNPGCCNSAPYDRCELLRNVAKSTPRLSYRIGSYPRLAFAK
jgi:hypothetical protein